MKTEWARVGREGNKAQPNLARSLGTAIRRRRSVLHISQDELAQRSGLHRTYVSDLERGARNPTVYSVQKIAGALQIPLAKLVESAELADVSL